MTIALAYTAIFILSLMTFLWMSYHSKHKDYPLDLIMAVIWPVAWLLIIGAVLGAFLSRE